MKEQCPKCGNWVEGKLRPSLTRKLTTGAIKKGGFKAAGTIIGSVVPGVGNAVGFGVGVLLDAVAGETVNKAIDEVADEVFENQEYEFICPKCGRHWKRTDSSNVISKPTRVTYSTSSSTSYSNNGERYAILELIKQCTSNKNINEGCSLTYAQINASKLVKKIQNQYETQIYEWQINSCKI